MCQSLFIKHLQILTKDKDILNTLYLAGDLQYKNGFRSCISR